MQHEILKFDLPIVVSSEIWNVVTSLLRLKGRNLERKKAILAKSDFVSMTINFGDWSQVLFIFYIWSKIPSQQCSIRSKGRIANIFPVKRYIWKRSTCASHASKAVKCKKPMHVYVKFWLSQFHFDRMLFVINILSFNKLFPS